MNINTQQIYLVPSKLSAPKLTDNIINRSRLDILDNLEEVLTVLCAPAGFGKTTAALQAYIHKKSHQSDTTLAWLSLDPEDSDPQHFCSYFISAIECENEISLSLKNAAFDKASQIKAVFGQLLFELNRVKHEMVIVLDDYHNINSDEIHQSLAYLIRNLPPHIKLIITTRIEPPACIMGLRLRGLIQEVSVDELAFNISEAKLFLGQYKNYQLDEQESQDILNFVEGWPIGIQLIALTLKSNVSLTEIKKRISKNNLNIIDYFEAEIFENLPDDIKMFMLKTSILKRFNELVSEELNDDINVFQCIDFLQRNHLFVLQIDEEDYWFRYHHLLREFLLHKLHTTDIDVRNLHIKASNVFLKQNLIVSAFEHAIQSTDKSLIRSLLINHGENLIHKAHYEIVNKCLESLSREEILSHPKLLQVNCWVEAIYGDAANIESLLSNSDRLLIGKTQKEQNDLSAEFSTIRAQSAYALHKFDDALRYAESSLKLFSKGNSRKQSALIIQANILADRGSLKEALELFEEAELMGRKANNHDAVLWALNQQAEINKAQGNFENSIGYSKIAVQYAIDNGVNYGFNLLFVNLNQSEIALENFHLREARQLINKMGKICSNWDKYWSIHLTGWLLKTEMLKGKSSVAKELAAEHEAIFHQSESSELLIPYSTEIQVLWWWSQLDIKNIQSWFKSHKYLPSYQNSRELMIFRSEIYSLLALKEYGQARERIETQLSRLSTSELRVDFARLSLLHVVVLSLIDLKSAVEPLKNLLPEIVELQLVSSSLILRQWLTPVLEELSESDLQISDRKFVEQLLLLDKQKNTSLVKGSGEIPDTFLSVGISKKEWIVFEKIISGSSNDDIANSMFVAVSTVKTHINNLYKKLGVQNRQEAIIRGREMLEDK